MKAYLKDFYVGRHEKTVYSANTILTLLLQKIPPVNSAIDLGCGVGTWLSVLRDKGIKEIKGLDGSWVDQNLLAIPADCFEQVDLSRKIKPQKKYDLAISLEVAEHLPSSQAKEFVLTLTELSDFVLFSAAIPFQGGKNHFNEQWQSYWVNLFQEAGYLVYDFIRPKIWNDNQIPVWYRQNILFFVDSHKAAAVLETDGLNVNQMPLDIVHPDLFIDKMQKHKSLKGSFKLFYRSLIAGSK